MPRMRVKDMVDQYRFGGLTLRRADPKSVLADMEAVAKIERTLDEKLDKIARDPRLTSVGRRVASYEAGQEARAAMEAWIGPKRKDWAGCEQHCRGQLAAAVARPKPTDAGERIEQAMLRAEVRRVAAGMTPDKLEALYRHGDATVRAALEELPRIVETEHGVRVEPFVSKELREEQLLTVGQQAAPEAADQLADVTEIRRLHERNVAFVDTYLRTLPQPTARDLAESGVPETHDPLRGIKVMAGDGTVSDPPGRIAS